MWCNSFCRQIDENISNAKNNGEWQKEKARERKKGDKVVHFL